MLELGEGGQHAELQPREGATRRGERAIDEGQANAEPDEKLEQVREGGELPRKAVDPVHHHVVDLAVLDGEEEFDEPVAAQGRAALAFVVEALREDPTLGAALVDVGGAAVSLKLAGRHGWVDAGARNRLPRVDGAADDAGRWSSGGQADAKGI